MENKPVTHKMLRIRLSIVTYRKFKVLCAQYDLSMPKQNAALIKAFVDTHYKEEK